MGLLGKIMGKTFVKLARKGDALRAEGQLGLAKLTYEDALAAADRDVTSSQRDTVEQNLAQTCHGLAEENAAELERLAVLGDHEEVLRLAELCTELSPDPALAERLAGPIEAAEVGLREAHRKSLSAAGLGQQAQAGPGVGADSDGFGEGEGDRFEILLGALPPAQAEEYRGLGPEFTAAYLALNDGELAVARLAFEQLAAAHPEAAHVGYEVARLRALAGELEGAAEDYARLVDGDGLDPDVRLRVMCELSDLRSRLGDTQAAEELACQAAEEMPDRVEPLVALARVLRRSGELDDAFAAARRALSMEPQEVSGHVELALVLDRQGETESAREQVLALVASSRGVPDLDEEDAARLRFLIEGD